ncbi:MAG: hypothetical protein CSB34_04555 [Desulfobulbus propionicus]|nr:MAG: hypothetical protein CSB34_04555 [Desulfobulbus propionicus]
MRGPLLKAGAVLLVFMLLVYFTSTSAEGSVWSSIAMIVVGAVRLVQWAIGMVIGVLLCLAVLIGIFLGAVAMVNAESAGQMYGALKVTLSEWLRCSAAAAGGIACSAAGASKEADRVAASVVTDLAKVNESYSQLEKKLSELSDKIDALEVKMAAFASVDKLDKVAGEVNASGDALQKLQDVLAGLEERVEGAVSKLNDMSSDKLLGDLPNRVKAVEQQDVASKEDLSALTGLVEQLQQELQEGISTVSQAVEEKGAENTNGDAEVHRLFSYFDDTADQHKIQELVESTLKKDMTYAQVMDFLIAEMGAEKGQIIADHPSLAKDFIRQCRRG